MGNLTDPFLRVCGSGENVDAGGMLCAVIGRGAAVQSLSPCPIMGTGVVEVRRIGNISSHSRAEDACVSWAHNLMKAEGL